MFLIGSLAAAALLIGLDQLIKWWAASSLSAVSEIRVIDGVLHLLYTENYGAAFSILQNQKFFLIGVTSVVMAAILVILLMRKITHPVLVAALSLILAGGAGNLIDRIARGYVVDYIYFVPINFPVFNLADCCVVIGTGLMLLYLLVLEPRALRARERDGREADGSER